MIFPPLFSVYLHSLYQIKAQKVQLKTETINSMLVFKCFKGSIFYVKELHSITLNNRLIILYVFSHKIVIATHF